MKRIILFCLLTFNASAYEIVAGYGAKHQAGNEYGELSQRWLGYDWAAGRFADGAEQASITRVFQYDSGWYTRLGFAWTNSDYTGPYNYRWGGGYRFGRFAVEFNHWSSNAVYSTNNGLDAIFLRVDLSGG